MTNFNFKDHQIFSNNLQDNAYMMRLKQLQLEQYLIEKKKASKKKDKKTDKKADKDYDGDGKLETSKEEHAGVVDNAIKSAIAKKKGNLKENNSGKITYGGFPKILNEVKYEIPAKGNPMDSDSLGAIGIDEFEKILKSGGHPLMAGQTENGRRGVPQEIRDTALMHLNKLKAHPQGQVDGYSADHPIYKEAMAAYNFFNTHFPAFGVEDQIAQDYNIH